MSGQTYEELIDRAGDPRVLIVGDLILDRYVSGEVSRISPEAPIPVLAASRAEDKLGGAGNVAANLVAMGARVDIVGVVGDEGWGRTLRELLTNLGVANASCVIDSSRPTVQKTRMMSGSHQMLRIDHESTRPVAGAVRDQVLATALAHLAHARAVVLSDYGKGVLTPEVLEGVIGAARAAGIPVLVDPKGEDYRRYRGATLITPNLKEAQAAIGRSVKVPADLESAADDLMRTAELDAAVITLGAEGIYFKQRGGVQGHVPATARAVFDVTGAGDTVVAQLGFFLACGVALPQAVALANHAAAIVVGRLGTHAVTRSELRALVQEASLSSRGKVVDPGDLDTLLATWRREGKRIVFTNGCFDILHAGHVHYLRYARSRGDVLLVGVNDDASVRRLKGADRPVNVLADRMEVLAALEMVDAVVPFSEDTPAQIITRTTPHVLVKGEDWKDKGVVGREWVAAHGGQVVLAPLLPGKSTTRILETVKGQADKAGMEQ
jgi:D-beta-D-heptose 7-phosphate kinase/D-beta-D-heptose 1-phosphate adenosyltransferase